MLTKFINGREGLYTVEGAFTITIFTALFMVLLSLMSVIQTKSFIREALNETAMYMSQYAYSYNSENDLSEKVSISACKTSVYSVLSKDHKELNEWLEKLGIEGGFDLIDFSNSKFLEANRYIDINAVYYLKINTFGLFDKTIQVSQRSKTLAWLPYDYEDRLGSGDGTDKETSIWAENPLIRGKYFANLIRGETPENSVQSGQGIDLYDSVSGTLTEVYSMNVFAGSYSDNDFLPKKENIISQIEEYAKDMQADINKLGGNIAMNDGSTLPLIKTGGKRIILIVPEEAKDSAYEAVLNSAAAGISKDYGIELVVKHIGKAQIND